MKVAFVTFGCRLNRAESLDLEARYRAAGHEIIDLGSVPQPSLSSGTVPKTSGAVPDLILVRGCSVTAKAQRDCEKSIAHLRTQFPTAEVRPIGCLPNAGPVPTIGPVPPENLGTVPQDKVCLPLQTSRAYLKIQDGCSGRCTFCIVPHFRGQPVSIPFDEIMVRTKSFLAAGYREIILTGCNLSLYHWSDHNLATLLSALAELGTDPVRSGTGPRVLGTDPGISEVLGTDSGISETVPRFLGTGPEVLVGTVPNVGTVPARIRIGSLEPGRVCEAVLDVMAQYPNICRFLHLSLQSGSNRILKRMNRPYEITWAERFCSAARERLGTDLALGADIITGFPSETEEDFEATRAFLERHAFSNLHVFPYSERPGTPAATMDGAIPRAVRLARARELTELGHRQRETFAQTFLGREVEVCVECGGEHGWTSAYLPCKWKSPAERRSLVRKRIIAVSGDTLLA
ncbi:MAG: radical SAM protein [Kiritimatiellae bacterium]|nr:radical SAM protein [Kiritimatiellia bacterium]